MPGNVVKNDVATQEGQSSPRPVHGGGAGVRREQQGQAVLPVPGLHHSARQQRGGRGRGNGMEVPSDAPYSDQPWPQPQKNYAAMITRLDRDVGRLLDQLQELGLDENTIVFFTSDNGPHKEGGARSDVLPQRRPAARHQARPDEGGIRVPLIVRWPGKIKAGTVSDRSAPSGTSCPPPPSWPGRRRRRTSTASHGADAAGPGQQNQHEFLYWEFHERGFQQAVRMGDWKAVRAKTGRPAGAVRPQDGRRRGTTTWPRIMPTWLPRSRPI